jgi:ribose transport system permease protein
MDMIKESASASDESSTPTSSGQIGGRSHIRGRLAHLLRRASLARLAGVVVALLAICSYLWATEPQFMTSSNWSNIVESQAVVGILALGMTFVVLTAGFDLSVSSMTAAAAVFTGIVLEHGAGWPVAVLVAVGSGVGLGLFNGSLIGFARIPFFVVTLGTLSIYQSVALLASGSGETISFLPFTKFNPVSNVVNGSTGPVPTILIVLVVMYLAGAFVLRYTGFGRSVYAVGSNRDAARLAGIPVTGTLVAVYTFAGLTVGLGALAQTGRLTAAAPTADPNLMLTVVAAVLIGGTAFTGGDGGLLGTAIGVLFLGVIADGLSLSSISSFWQGAVSGVILIVAVGLGVLRDYGWRLQAVRRTFRARSASEPQSAQRSVKEKT